MKTKGALLLELLIVISLLATILSFGANAVFLSIRSGKVSGERDVANALAFEALEAARATAEESWETVYGLTKSTQHYKTVQSDTKWTLVAGDETINLNEITYTRYVTINNVSRDDAGGIFMDYDSSADDPSTQKFTITVSWADENPIVLSEYVFRWKNKICGQTDWSGGVGTGVKACPNNTYESKDANLDASAGQLKLQ